MPPKTTPAGESILFLLNTLFEYLKIKGQIPPPYRNMTALNKFMKKNEFKNKHSEFMKYHLSMINHDTDRNVEDTQMLGEKKRSIMFNELCTLINCMTGISQTSLPLIRLKNLTIEELLDEDDRDLYILQVTWNRETKQTLKNLKGDPRSLRIYRGKVKLCDDEVSQTDDYDDQFSGLLLYVGGYNLGQASHIKTKLERIPTSADELFNLGKNDDNCCGKMGKNATHPKLIKSIEAVYKLLLTEKDGVLGKLDCPYNVSSPVSVPPQFTTELEPIPVDEERKSPAMSSSATARRAQLSAGLKNVQTDDQGFEDLSAFWDEGVKPAFEEKLSPQLSPKQG